MDEQPWFIARNRSDANCILRYMTSANNRLEFSLKALSEVSGENQRPIGRERAHGALVTLILEQKVRVLGDRADDTRFILPPKS
jgi:3-methyladenine DNA glycosylase/8-oxoguanine DNA glycosylase